MASVERLSLATLSHFDVDLQRFYFEALNKELDILSEQNSRSIKSALKEVVEAYKKPTGDISSPANSIRFDSAAKRCAYVLKHSPCFTSAVAGHVMRLVKNCPNALRDMVMRGEVSLCCLGGGPASDAVGVCRVLSALHRQFWSGSRADGDLRVRVSVVDVNEDWAVTAANVLRTVTDRPELLGIEGVELFFDFFTADLTRPIEGKVRRVLEAADVVTMVYFLSAVNRGRDRIESLQMVKEIMSCTREGSVLFFLDSAMDVHYRQMDSASKSLGNLERIYGPRIEEFHTLSLESVRTFLELYKRHFGKFLCLTNCFVSSSAWQKSSLDCEYLYLSDKMVECTCNLLSLDKSVMDRPLVGKRLDIPIESFRDSVERCVCLRDSLVDKSETLLVGKLLMDKCARLAEEEDFWWRKSHRQTVRLTARMVQFRAQIGKLLADEFEQVVEGGIFDDLEPPPDDASDHLLVEYCRNVPEYFFQTKSKKKRIFTGLPVSI